MQKKHHHLKLYRFILVLLFLVPSICYAYQTVIVNFPEDVKWHMVYNKKKGNETIVQYVPEGQSYGNWQKTFIFHSYNVGINKKVYPHSFLKVLTTSLEKKNNTKPYKLIQSSEIDSIVGRCINSNANMKAQCDIFRVTKAQEGLISIQYINKNANEFRSTYLQYLNAVRDANPYYSAYRYDRVMSKGTSFEL